MPFTREKKREERLSLSLSLSLTHTHTHTHTHIHSYLPRNLRQSSLDGNAVVAPQHRDYLRSVGGTRVHGGGKDAAITLKYSVPRNEAGQVLLRPQMKKQIGL